MTNAIEIRGLKKSFKNFELDIGDIDIPKGYVTGVIGNNGAGKSTLINCITGVYIPTSGIVKWDRPREQGDIGLVCGECPIPLVENADKVSKTMSRICSGWDDAKFRSLCRRYDIDGRKKVNEYSDGMKKSIQIAAAFSHPTDLMIFDEPTSGLDPIRREDFLDMIRGYMEDDTHTVIITSHIMTDIERVADNLIFIKDGNVILSGSTDEILEEYGIMRSYDDSFREHCIAVRKGEYSSDALIKGKNKLRKEHPELKIDNATIEDITVYLIRGDH